VLWLSVLRKQRGIELSKKPSEDDLQWKTTELGVRENYNPHG